MMEASTAMRISQSAVSKRIAALERYYDRELIERHGRRVVLTHHGTRLVERVTPLLPEAAAAPPQRWPGNSDCVMSRSRSRCLEVRS